MKTCSGKIILTYSVSTVKTDSKFRVIDSRSCKRFLNVFGLQLVSSMADKLFQTFRGEEVPLFTTFLPLFYHITVSNITRVLSIIEGWKFHQNISIIKGNNFYFGNFVVR